MEREAKYPHELRFLPQWGLGRWEKERGQGGEVGDTGCDRISVLRTERLRLKAGEAARRLQG